MLKKPQLLIFFSILFSTTTFAWNSVGHRLVAQIAYDQLTPEAKAKVDALTAVMFHSPYPDARFARAAVWPDQYRHKNTSTFTWHFIDMPIVKDNVKAPMLSQYNVVWGIMQAEKTLENSVGNTYERAKYLSFLVHFIGDIHQPLHCVSLYNTHFPSGDRGGNDYVIHSPVANNLHGLWDEGVGLFAPNPVQYQFHYYEIQKLATDWMRQYPRSFFGARITEQSPQTWAQENHQIAANFVYSIPMNTAPSAAYTQQGQTIVREQVVLAGDRLADVLNHVF